MAKSALLEMKKVNPWWLIVSGIVIGALGAYLYLNAHGFNAKCGGRIVPGEGGRLFCIPADGSPAYEVPGY